MPLPALGHCIGVSRIQPKSCRTTPAAHSVKAGGGCPGTDDFRTSPTVSVLGHPPLPSNVGAAGTPLGPLWDMGGTAARGSWSRAWGTGTPETGIHELFPKALFRECFVSAGKTRMDRGTYGDRGLPPAPSLPPPTAPHPALGCPGTFIPKACHCPSEAEPGQVWSWLSCSWAVSVTG